MLDIPELTDAAVAFGDITSLPAWDDIPEDFRKEWHRDSHKWCRIPSELFYKGGKLSDFGLTPKEGVDAKLASRAVHACLGSWTPSHEHKIAGVAYMLSEWFDMSKSKAALARPAPATTAQGDG